MIISQIISGRWRERVIRDDRVVKCCRRLVSTYGDAPAPSSHRAVASQCIKILVVFCSHFQLLFPELGCREVMERCIQESSVKPDRSGKFMVVGPLQRVSTQLYEVLDSNSDIFKAVVLAENIGSMIEEGVDFSENKLLGKALVTLLELTNDSYHRTLAASHLSNVLSIHFPAFRRQLYTLLRQHLTPKLVSAWWNSCDIASRFCIEDLWKRLLGEVYWLLLDPEVARSRIVDERWVKSCFLDTIPRHPGGSTTSRQISQPKEYEIIAKTFSPLIDDIFAYIRLKYTNPDVHLWTVFLAFESQAHSSSASTSTEAEGICVPPEYDQLPTYEEASSTSTRDS
ncbi:hypothetical protein JAAARDRAFT_81622 [Jaapia argillacea MUCL 33604]|uniref:Uncharacterized protein n=1 Tax=Jaapia argillacea MUCL 33604 TaxID=933084 RepID=A0A067PKR5_9AGAM|nr:hypothetical protein JAAARDRAFT_81622 [Jaapia argillacea MUCL 33604]